MDQETIDQRHREMQRLVLQLFSNRNNREGNPPTISEPDDPDTLVIVDQIIELLKHVPSLATVSFDFTRDDVLVRDDDQWGFPLQAFVRAGVSIQKIAELAALNPAFTTLNDSDEMSILHYACHAWNRDSVPAEDLLLLAQRWPALLSHNATLRSSTRDTCPIIVALRERKEEISQHVLQELLTLLNEESANISEFVFGHIIQDAIHMAILSRCRTEVIRHLMQRRAETHTFCLRSKLKYTEMPILGLPLAEEICSLFSELKTLQLGCAWTPEALRYVLTWLKENTSIVDLSLSLPYDTISQDEETLQLLRAMNKNCSSGFKIKITNKRVDRDNGQGQEPENSSILEALSRRKLGKLEMTHLIVPSPKWLACFLASDTAPSSLVLEDPKSLLETTAPCPLSSMTSRLQYLKITDTHNILGGFYDLLFSQLQLLPKLRILSLRSNYKDILTAGQRAQFTRFRVLPDAKMMPDISTCLHEFLRRSPVLKSLDLQGFVFDHEKLCEALKDNTTLEEVGIGYMDWDTDHKTASMYIDVLKKHNTTLTILRRGQSSQNEEVNEDEARIKYHLEMNQIGRGRLRNNRATSDDVVDLLENVFVRNDPNSPEQPFQKWEARRVSMAYDVLRECPSLWCKNSGWKKFSPLLNFQTLTFLYAGEKVKKINRGGLALQRHETTMHFRLAYNGLKAEKDEYCLLIGATEITREISYCTYEFSLSFDDNEAGLENIWICCYARYDLEASMAPFGDSLEAVLETKTQKGNRYKRRKIN